MNYFFNCECGVPNYVSASQAGSSLQCICGKQNCVPSLSKLSKNVPTAEEMTRLKQDVDRAVRTPALIMIIFATVSVLLNLYALQGIDDFYKARFSESDEIGRGVTTIHSFAVFVSLVYVIYGGIRMRQLRDYGHARAAAILCLIPCVNPALGFIWGLYALHVLSREDVKSAFEQRAQS